MGGLVSGIWHDLYYRKRNPMWNVHYSVLNINTYLVTIGGLEVGGGGRGELLQTERFVQGGGGCKVDFHCFLY